VGVRTVVLRDTGPEGVGLLISSTSPKWAPLEQGRAECLLVWLTIRRQYRLRGPLAPMPEVRVARYWSQKVHESRLLDLYYSRHQGQSTRVASREAFLDGIEGLRREHPTADAVPRPDALCGVYLQPERIEIWRGSPDRLHDRRLFEWGAEGGGWRESVLVP
jgi:pyridoxamine 5'-phosphate oxidase